ncbi:MAG: DinB family protein [Anaerolineales bacterium]
MNAAEYFDQWDRVRRDLLRGVAVLKDEHLSFRPAESYDRTVGDILRHIIRLEQGWIHFVVRRELEDWPDESSTRPNTVDGIRDELTRVNGKTMAYLATVPIEDFNRLIQVPGDGTPKLSWILWHVLEQQIHHRGELFMCLSLLGLERPEIDRPGQI